MNRVPHVGIGQPDRPRIPRPPHPRRTVSVERLGDLGDLGAVDRRDRNLTRSRPDIQTNLACPTTVSFLPTFSWKGDPGLSVLWERYGTLAPKPERRPKQPLGS
jgi:hypothetical protein